MITGLRNMITTSLGRIWFQFVYARDVHTLGNRLERRTVLTLEAEQPRMTDELYELVAWQPL